MTGIATIGKNINIKSDGAMKKKISKKIMCISRIFFFFWKIKLVGIKKRMLFYTRSETFGSKNLCSPVLV